jgi:cytidylate kinase
MADFDGVITLDGPTGAGKTTLGQWLADELGYEYLESGYLYRAATHRAVTEGIAQDEWDARLVAGLSAEPRPPRTGAAQEVRLGDRALSLTDDLFSTEVDALVARVSAVASLRQAVRKLLRGLAADRKLILSGRDAGTKIVPEAPHKFFLTAMKEVRSARREGRDPAKSTPIGRSRGGGAEPMPRHELESRLLGDHLQPAPDALVIDTTNASIDTVRAIALNHLERADDTSQR